ncbi:hypothetical protein ACHAXR_007438 [Thalassiosira sp. AJA248-18]
MSSEASTGNASPLRKLAVASLFALANILAWHSSTGGQSSQGDIAIATGLSFFQTSEQMLTSGVGLVTTDGMWEKNPDNKFKDEDIKILGFTDKYYVPIAKWWYQRLTLLGYTEHYIVAHDQVAYDNLMKENHRVIPCIIKDPEYSQPVKGLWRLHNPYSLMMFVPSRQQIMGHRLRLTSDLLKNGTHLLITDIDNVFSRHVPLYGFLEEGYDVFHAYEMAYPRHIFDEMGFVICSGHQFLRSSPATLRYFDLIMKRCPFGRCDDQVTYNEVLYYDLGVKWDNMDTPNHTEALRIKSTDGENNNILVESVTGRSEVTNHTIKIWDRDFAWRMAGAIPEYCPSINNWVGMPTKLPEELTGVGYGKVFYKIAGFDVWDKYCRIERHKSS